MTICDTPGCRRTKDVYRLQNTLDLSEFAGRTFDLCRPCTLAFQLGHARGEMGEEALMAYRTYNPLDD